MRIYTKNSSRAGSDCFPQSLLIPAESKWVDIDAHWSSIPVHRAVLPRQGTGFPGPGSQDTHQILLQLLLSFDGGVCLRHLSAQHAIQHTLIVHGMRSLQVSIYRLRLHSYSHGYGFRGLTSEVHRTKDRASTGAITCIMSSTSANVKSASCCGMGNPAVSQGSCL